MHLTDSQIPLERELSTTSSLPDIDLAVPWANCHGHYESQKSCVMLSKTCFLKRQIFFFIAAYPLPQQFHF